LEVLIRQREFAYLFIELKAQIVAGLALIFNIMGDHGVEKTATQNESLQ
jgi:hypothetical protein